MVNKKYVIISYFMAFFGVYFLFMLYSLIAVEINSTRDFIPETPVINSTSMAISSFSDAIGVGITIIVIIITIFLIFFLWASLRTMGSAYS